MSRGRTKYKKEKKGVKNNWKWPLKGKKTRKKGKKLKNKGTPGEKISLHRRKFFCDAGGIKHMVFECTEFEKKKMHEQDEST